MASSNTNPNARVSCTFDGCRYYFRSVEEMKKHKSRFPEHEYCMKCDQDFQDEECHLIHKIRSTKHVACPICGEDFKSEGGRDAHIRQFHRADQDITCIGCGAKFRRAAALMEHIESNQCETITSETYTQERAKKAVLKEAVARVLKSDDVVPVGTTRIGSDVSSVDGGVAVEPPSLLDDADDKQTEAGNSTVGNGRALPSVARSTISNMTSLKHWPTLGSERNARKEEYEEDIDGDLMNFSTLSVRDDQPRPSTYAQSIGGSGLGRWGPDTATTDFGLDRDSGEMVSSRSKNKWDPNRFFDPCLGVYTCICAKNFYTLADFETHLASRVHDSERIRCPACYKIFKTNAALVAHAESATVKCQVSQSHNFNSIIQDMSGGVIEATGHHIDGTVRFEAGQIIDVEKTTPTPRRTKW